MTENQIHIGGGESTLRRMLMGNNEPKWLQMAFKAYPELKPYKANLLEAHDIDPDIEKSFDGTERWISNTERGMFVLDGYKPTNNTRIISGYIIKSFATDISQATSPFGCANGYKVKAYEVMLPVNGNTKSYYVYGNNEISKNIEWNTNTKYTIDANKNILNITRSADSRLISTFNVASSSFSTEKDLGIFALNRGTQKINSGRALISVDRLIIYDNDIMSHFVIPILKDGVATMVDLMQDPTTDAAYPTKVGTFTIE